VSAFDKLMHDLIRIGMVEIFMGNRPTTPQYLAETITISTYSELTSATFLPKELVFEQAIVRKLKTVSYQTPDNVAKGLSYIWNEPQKWQKIASNMAMDTEAVKTELKLIVDQRNRIVHEADINPSTNQKYSITKSDSQSVTDFLQKAGEAIYTLVV
jgi:predicted nucleic-acid-binding protein